MSPHAPDEVFLVGCCVACLVMALAPGGCIGADHGSGAELALADGAPSLTDGGQLPILATLRGGPCPSDTSGRELS